MVRHDIARFYTPIDPEQRIGIDCVDDRGYSVIRQSIQTAAGPFGHAQDTHAAGYAVYGPDMLRYSIGTTAKVAAKVLEVAGYDAGTHEACAAELGARKVAHEIVDNPTVILPRAAEIAGGDIPEEWYEQTSRYYEHYHDETGYYRGAETEAVCMSSDGAYPGIRRFGLASEEHAAPEFLANHLRGMVFDTHGAYQQGVPHYNFDVWAIPLLAEKVSIAFPVDPERVLAASAIRHAAIIGLLPNSRSETGHGVDLHVVAA